MKIPIRSASAKTPDGRTQPYETPRSDGLSLAVAKTRKRSRGNAITVSVKRATTVSVAAAVVAGDRSDRDGDQQSDQDGAECDLERGPGTVEHADQLVPAERPVCAEHEEGLFRGMVRREDVAVAVDVDLVGLRHVRPRPDGPERGARCVGKRPRAVVADDPGRDRAPEERDEDDRRQGAHRRDRPPVAL